MNELTIDFVYLDLSTCRRCQATDKVLDEALDELREHLRSVKEVTVRKIRVTNDAEAKRYHLTRSPSVWVNGVDIEVLLNEKTEVTDNHCSDCAQFCGSSYSEVTGGNSNCRTFEYNGKKYDSPPKEMIKDAIRLALEIGEEHKNDKPKNSCCPD